MSSNGLRFSEAEIQKLKDFFEQLHIDHREFKDDTFECKTEENDTVFIFSWKGSCWGYHDESWYDIASFTLTKSYLSGTLSDLTTDDKIVCSIAKQAEEIRINKQTFVRESRYNRNEMVFYADRFLGISEAVKIDYRFCKGEW